MRERMYFFDYLRAAIILLVIVFHVAIGYMDPAPQWWYVVDTQHHVFFNLFVMDTDVFIMPVMFLIAGYFALPVLKQQGASVFWQKKLVRIVLPWLAGVLLFAPAITYMIWFSRTPTPPPYFTYWRDIFFGPTVFNHAHYWFLGVLTYFYAALTLVYALFGSRLTESAEPKAPGRWLPLCVVLVAAAGFFLGNLQATADTWFGGWYIISFQPTRLPVCAVFFALGVYAWRQQWFTANGYRPGLTTWLAALAVVLVAFTLYRINFLTVSTLPVKAGHAFLHSALCYAATMALIAWFQRFHNRPNPLWQRLAASSYIIYYIHQAVVLPLAYGVQKVEANVWLKYIGVSGLAVVLCYWLAEYGIRRGVLRGPKI